MSAFRLNSIIIFFLLILITNPSISINFTYTGFNETVETQLEYQNGATVDKTGALKLTGFSINDTGQAFYPFPIKFFSRNSTNSSPINVTSFSTYFIFSIVSPVGHRGGHGLAFTLSPEKKFAGAEAGHYMGIFNSSNDGSYLNHIVAVEFDTVNGYNEGTDTDGNHIGININGMASIATEPASYYVKETDKKEEVYMETGDPIQVWIDFDGEKKILNVTVAPHLVPRPIKPLKSRDIDLSEILTEEVYVGFSAATGRKTSSHYILGWSLTLNGLAAPIDPSLLPIPPKPKRLTGFSLVVKVLLGALATSIVLLFAALVYLIVYRIKVEESDRLEEWELDYPHRFKYNDLCLATKGFKESELIGSGGFGAVYKGVLPSTGSLVAVKKIKNNSIQGMREFVAEIESLGRLRHKNLVNLQGWCKRKNKLLLVYDHVSKGSLDTLLLRPMNGFVLRWDQRVRIMKDVAAGLLYLHEEWEQVVIHRDVKPSNVLVDGEMGARLGDFGLARLYDHGQNSNPTKVVGTIGYIAPELAKTGRSSTSSDVFAFGVVVIELVCGRGPIISVDREQIMLVDWIIDRIQAGETGMNGFVDPRLGGEYVVEEVEKFLKLGLVCCHPSVRCRPSMRQVTRYLDGDDSIPRMDETFRDAISGHVGGSKPSYFGVVAMSSDGGGCLCSNKSTSSYGDMSFTSQQFGR
ncbi:probable L-type lectin-domain containing receptor kinase VI.1 [Impatiens glandulifera]|uniref:probable L-type lectin-domain containing receptor kinase VI.1 n=1 Tax=Impatiens glandulifera TaxID=253017 RepID=UPI001FB16BD8|nr:probable L-type lectin-domain containing receptor kinase VI.1 [Impatiens glandulifera]